MMKPLSLFSILLLLTPMTLLAQDWRGDSPDAPNKVPALPSTHIGTSPFSPRAEDDTRFVVDAGSGLDTGCTFRSGGPLRIHLMVKRFVGPVAADGTLSDPNGLVSRHLISPMAHIRLPAYDVDVNGAPGFPPEVDRIFFNGHDVGTLTGDNNIWKLNEFDVPIAWVKFPAMGSPGSPPAPADNLIQVNIDEASLPPAENWCTSVDWVEIEFSAVAPIFLVHGANAQSDTWDPNFTMFFGNSRAPWSNDINLLADGTILGNGRLLADRLFELATSFGAKKCHVIAHSKGGVDTRAYLNNRYDPDRLKVLSVYTLSTPHHGSILADVAVVVRNSTNPESSDPDIQYLINKNWFLSHIAKEPALSDLKTGHMTQFNAMYPGIPGSILFYNFGADADLNNNHSIEAGETDDLIPSWVVLVGISRATLGTALYRTIGNTASIIVTPGIRPGRLWGQNTFTAIEVNPTKEFAFNDLAVSTASARSPFGSYLATRDANHGSMKSTNLAMTILQHILTDFPNL